MAKFDQETIKYLTLLSRIDCTEAEQQALLHDLKNILDYFEQLQELDTTGVPPCNQVLKDMQNVMRKDIVGCVMPREDFLANAPSQIGGLIKVPPVIKQS